MMLKSRFRDLGVMILEKLRALEGSGIGNIPGVIRVYEYLNSIFGLKTIEVDEQNFLYPFILFSSYQQLSENSFAIEPAVSSLFCSFIKDGMTVVDIGAGIGYYTLLAAKRVGDEGLVLSFEPDSFRFRILQKNARVNNWQNVRLFKIALSDKNERRKMKRGVGFTPKGIGGKVTVKVATLDSFLGSADVIKIDVEGAELEVLRGMEKILVEGKAKIICEVHPQKICSLGHQISEITELLERYNYSIYLIEEGSKLIQVDGVLMDKYAHYLFAKMEK